MKISKVNFLVLEKKHLTQSLFQCAQFISKGHFPHDSQFIQVALKKLGNKHINVKINQNKEKTQIKICSYQ